jgi:hypothetical protein
MAKRKFKFGDRVHTKAFKKAVVAFNCENGEIGILPEFNSQTVVLVPDIVKPGWLKKARGKK